MNQKVLVKLKSWRQKKADLEKCELYRIFQNKTLEDMATLLPKTKDELLAIKGIRDKKFQKYGKDVLTIIHECLGTEPVEPISLENDKTYSGVLLKEVSQEVINQLYSGDVLMAQEIFPYEDNVIIYPNQIVILKQFGVKSGSCITVAQKQGNNIFLKVLKKIENCYGLIPRNKEQQFSLSLLYDPNIKLVTLTGIAGSGKSLLALAAGLDQNCHMGSKKTYEKLVIARSTQPVGKDIGYLPGSLNEKLAPWQGASCDNLAFLMNKNKNDNKKPLKPHKTQDGQFLDPYLSLLMENGIIEIASIAHIRGRSIPNSFVIIEEAQNLSHHEIKTILTRIGESSKIVLCGDTDQIDNMLLDKFTNGLTYVIEKFKESTLSAHVNLIKGERSTLATEASQLL
jgi:PhoH-like ATPase